MSNPPITATNGTKPHGKNNGKSPDTLIPQSRGGALRAAGKRGNKGGTGRPPEALRIGARAVFEKWLEWAALKVADPDTDDALMLQIGSTAGKYGLGTTITPTNTAGDDLPPLVYRIGGGNASDG